MQLARQTGQGLDAYEKMQRYLTRQKQLFIKELAKLHESVYILSPDMFAAAVRDIRFYHSATLIDDYEKEALKAEMLEMIDSMEQAASSGCTMKGKQLKLYLSELAFSPGYILCGDSCYLGAVTSGAFISSDSRSREAVRSWMIGMMRHSTLISVCGGQERYKYFAREKELVNTL